MTVGSGQLTALTQSPADPLESDHHPRHTPTTSWLSQWDGRLALPCLLLVNLTIVSQADPRWAAISLLGVLLLTSTTRAPWRRTLGMLLPINGLLMSGFLILGITGDGERFSALGLSWSVAGTELGAAWLLRGNAAMLLTLVVIASRPLTHTLSALAWWRCPAPLLSCAFLTLRFGTDLSSQWQALNGAARLRGWQPRCNVRSLRIIGWMLGAWLLRTEQRSLCIYQHMQLRGGDGTFPTSRWPRFDLSQLISTLAIVVFCLIILVLPWLIHSSA